MDFYRDPEPEEWTVDAKWQRSMRHELLKGHLPLRNIPKLQPTCAKIYLSSASSDSESERRYFIENIYGKLREYCRAAHGIEFQVVDLRSGVDRQSCHVLPSITSIRLFEIEQCLATSTGPSFVCFLGQRYVNDAIPPLTIAAEEFRKRMIVLEENGHDVKLLQRYYKMDENKIPSHYVLCPDLVDIDIWIETERRLSELFYQSSSLLGHNEYLNPPADISEELKAGLYNIARQKTRDDNCIMIRRIIKDMHVNLEKKHASKFIDLTPASNEVDSDAQQALEDECQTVQAYLAKNNQFTFEVCWSEPFGIHSLRHKDYLVSLGNLLFEKVRRHTDICMIEWGHYPSDPLYVEVQQHWLHTRNNLEHFYEQGQYLQAIEKYTVSQSSSPLIVHGTGGSGKSAVLSKVISSACEKASSLRVVIRHLGYTPSSSDTQLLLQSLLEQLSEIMGLVYEKPKTFLEAKLSFKNLMRSGCCNCTLLVVIDGLERLSTVGYDRIDWLPLSLSPNIKLVISVRDDNDIFDTFSSLKCRYPNEDNYVKVDNMLPETCEWILQKRLKMIGRTVTPEQWKKISNVLHECPYPLFVELVFQYISKWKSYDSPNLPTSISDMLDLMLADLEVQQGRIVVSHVLSLITCSKYGLTESEIEDILSLDEEVMSLFPEASDPALPVHRIPSLVWSKIKYSLHPFLAVWKVDGVNLVTWRVFQFAEAIRRRYLSDREFLTKIHGLLSEFFLGSWSGISKKPFSPYKSKSVAVDKEIPEKSSHRNVISQPLIVSGHGTTSRINVRKLNELPYHLSMSNKISALKSQVLFNYEWMHTKLTAMSLVQLIDDFSCYDDPEVRLVREALQDCQEFNPNILGVELSGRLLPFYKEYPNIRSLLDQCDLQAQRRCFVVPKLQLYNTPGSFLEHEFKSSLQPSNSLQVLSITKKDSAYVIIKHYAWNYAILRNVWTREETLFNGFPDNSFIYITPDQKVIVAKRNDAIETYDVDSQQMELSIPVGVGAISCSGLSDNYFAFSLHQKTGPFVVDIKFPSVVHRFNHHSTAVTVSEDSSSLVCNDGKQIHVYQIPLMTRQVTIATDDVPHKLITMLHPLRFCELSASSYVRMYSVHEQKKVSHMTVILQEPSIKDIKLSPDKSLLMIHSKKYIKVYTILHKKIRAVIRFSEASEAHDIVSADFSHDGQKIVACKERSIGVFDANTGETIRICGVPFPSDVWFSLVCSHDKAVTLLENGKMNTWNLDYTTSDKIHKNNYYPSELTAFSVSHDGKLMAVCSKDYPAAKVVSCDNGQTTQRFYDSFAAGSQPLSVEISPCGKFVVTRCENDADGTIDWPFLKSDYVWNTDLSRVTHFFINNYSVNFSNDDDAVVAVTCSGFTALDPSNKFFVALCYKTEGDDPTEHKILLPDGDMVGRPLISYNKKWLMCLIQPCIKTKLSGMVTQQRVDTIQLYLFDLFTISARDRRSIDCSEVVGEKKTFFISMREMHNPSQVMLIYARGALPSYREDFVLDMTSPMSKGMIIYDVTSGSVNHHLPNFLEPNHSVDDLLISKFCSVVITDFKVFSAKSGKLNNKIAIDFDICATIKPVLLLDGNYMVVITSCRTVAKFINCRNGAVVSHIRIHGSAVQIYIGNDDRTLFISTLDGRVMVVVCVMELCDPVTMVVRNLKSRHKD